jgi:hypothetical protein
MGKDKPPLIDSTKPAIVKEILENSLLINLPPAGKVNYDTEWLRNTEEALKAV